MARRRREHETPSRPKGKSSPSARLEVLKTYKLYVGGAFVRSESGRSFRASGATGEAASANVARASRKDLRAAVTAARKAFAPWAGRTAYLRSQILYRAAEMLEGRRDQFAAEIAATTGASRREAEREVAASVDRAVWYAGWADKVQTVLGSLNPVAAPYFSFSVVEPVGVVGVLAPDERPLLGLVSTLFPVIASGNAAVVLVSERAPLAPLTFGEILATSDFPAGVVNLLAGERDELLPHLGKHMDVDAVLVGTAAASDAELVATEGAENLKRVRVLRPPTGGDWLSESAQSPLWIEPFVEIKTIWHPIGV
jgi:acyl-CoA reductase-like NAD-dependent aldehyde dehydrogenase